MFQRGQKIVILKSSASKRAHPAVGDIGYLNNMHFFFKDRFILLNAFFLSYKQDQKAGKDRCEDKRFLIDMGMKKALKHRLTKAGIPRKFFIKNPYTTNLTPIDYTFARDYVEHPDITSIWGRTCDSKGRSLLGNKVKIPYGQIAALPNAKKPIGEEGANALHCWVSCLYQALAIEIGQTDLDMLDVPTIGSIATSIYNNSLSEFLSNKNRYNSGYSSNAVKDMRMIQVMAKFLIDNCDNAFLKSYDIISHKRQIKSLWSTNLIMNRIIKMVDDEKAALKFDIVSQSRYAIRGMINLFLRTILTNGDTKSKLMKLRYNGVLPWELSSINKSAKILEEIKQKANSDSAALARIFEIGLF